MTRILICLLCNAMLLATAMSQPPSPRTIDANVVNSPNVIVANTPDVVIANDASDPVGVVSSTRRTPVLCVLATFTSADGPHDALCVTPTGIIATPVPSGVYLAITDVVATSQAPAGSLGQAVVRVTSRNDSGVTFGAGVPMILKPGETQSLHYQTPHQILPSGRTPRVSLGLNFGDVYPVEVDLTGYLVSVDDLGRQ